MTGCKGPLSREDPLPSQIVNQIDNLESITAPLTEYVPQLVLAVSILKYNTHDNGTVGKVCDAIDLVEPNIQEQLTLRTSEPGTYDSSTTGAIQNVLEQFSEISQTLNCEFLAQS